MTSFLKTLFLCWFVCGYVNARWKKYEGNNFKNIPLRKNLIVQCYFNAFALHWMLAIDSDHIINVQGDKSKHKGVIRVERQENVDDRSYGTCYTEEAPPGTAERALEWQDVPVYYDLGFCNCEHWIKYWSSRWDWHSDQTLMVPSSSCPISHAQYFTLYQHSNHGGRYWYSSVDQHIRCMNVPYDFNDEGSSVNTYGNCVVLWEHKDCQGTYMMVAPGIGFHYNFDQNDFNDMVSSVGICG